MVESLSSFSLLSSCILSTICALTDKDELKNIPDLLFFPSSSSSSSSSSAAAAASPYLSSYLSRSLSSSLSFNLLTFSLVSLTSATTRRKALLGGRVTLRIARNDHSDGQEASARPVAPTTREPLRSYQRRSG